MRILSLLNIVAILTLLVLSGCRKDTVSFVPYPSAIENIKALLKKVPPTNHITTATLNNPSSNIILVSPQNSRVIFDPATTRFQNALGEEVNLSNCAQAKVVLQEYLSKSALVAKSFSLQAGSNPTKTTGIVHLECYCNDQALTLAQGEQVNIQIQDQENELNESYNMFTGTLGAPDSISNWTNTGQEVFLAKYPRNAPYNDTLNMYSFETKKLGWITGMQSVSSSVVDFCVELDDYYLPQNTAIYLIFDAYKSTVAMVYDENLKQFCAKDVPNASDVQIILVSKIGEEWKMSSSAANTGSSGNSLILIPTATLEQNIINEFRLYD